MHEKKSAKKMCAQKKFVKKNSAQKNPPKKMIHKINLQKK